MNISFFNIMLCYSFSLEAVLQGMVINNPNEKQIDAEIQATLKHWPDLKLKVYRFKLQTDLNHKLQLLALEYQQQSPKTLQNSPKNTYAGV